MPRHRIVLGIMGGEGSGKTDMALTAPTPQLILGCDPNVEDVVCKHYDVDSADDLDPDLCTYVDLPFPAVGFERDEKVIADEAYDSWDKMVTAIGDVITKRAKPMPKAVILDSGTRINTLNTLAEFGRTDKIAPGQRRMRMGEVNNRFMGLFRGLEQTGTLIVITHQCKNVWETIEVRGRNGVEEKDVMVPGKFERVGFKQMGYILNTEVLTLFDPDREGKLAERFGVRVVRSMQRPAIVGKEYWGRVEVGDEKIRAASIPHIATLLYPKTTLDEWR